MSSASASPPAKRSRPAGTGSRGKRTRPGRWRKQAPASPEEETLELELREIVGQETYDGMLSNPTQREDSAWKALQIGDEIQVEIAGVTSLAQGVAVSPDKRWAVLVPFCVPGDVLKVRVYRHAPTHSLADFIEVVKPGPTRNDQLIRCRYFGKCSGCQYQMVEYDQQLKLKKVVVESALKHFSGLDKSLIPVIEETLPSPLQYGYRTKLTPHFELPRPLKNKNSAQVSTSNGHSNAVRELAIGFLEQGRKRVIDIEECPIGTATVNQGLLTERERIQNTIQTFKRGATLLLRDSLVSGGKSCDTQQKDSHVCITDHKAIAREKVLDKYFEQNAGSFFQNNSSILDPFLNYVTEILPKYPGENYLVDAYCGSGLFSICLAQYFTKTIGIELAEDSLRYAKHNAQLNSITNSSFIVGKAEAIFQGLDFQPSQTTVIIDPPRKGCDDAFLNQLLKFKPRTIIYVSCNVRTQARDIGKLVSWSSGDNTRVKDGKLESMEPVKQSAYKLERIRGADFFPQTHHCESIALLKLT